MRYGCGVRGVGRAAAVAGVALLLVLVALGATQNGVAAGLAPSRVRSQIRAAKEPAPGTAADAAGALNLDAIADFASPYLSIVPSGVDPKLGAWRRHYRERSQAGAAAEAMEALLAATSPKLAGVAAATSSPTALVSAGESEPNDDLASADLLLGFGTAPGESRDGQVSGAIGATVAPAAVGPFAEDDGAIPLATPIGVSPGSAVRLIAVRGDGPYGSAGTGSGDFDFYAVPGVAAGDWIHVDIDTPMPFSGDLDPVVALWDASGQLLAFNDDDFTSYDSQLVVPAPAAGTYYVSVGGFGSELPDDPFDAASGPGAGSEGSYTLTIGRNAIDVDVVAVELAAGDVISAKLLGLASWIELLDPTGAQRIASAQDLSAVHPFGPLLGSGAATFAYVADQAGTWGVRVLGPSVGAYDLSVRAVRSHVEELGTRGERQILFVDFDGGAVERWPFGGGGVASLSPLASFLVGWGLLASDEDGVIDAILATLDESLSADLQARGGNAAFDLEIRNSRDHADPWGGAKVSRLVIGGTIAEFGASVIGLAQSVDVGNLDPAETAVVLLDLLSAPASNPNSLNQFGTAGSATKVDLVGRGVGNVAAHEAGHLLASWHTEPGNATANLMDAGGGALAGMVGVGPDLVLGTLDDVDVDFGRDDYAVEEGFLGTEDTLTAPAFGMSAGIGCAPAPLGSCLASLGGYLELKDDALVDAKDAVVFRWVRGATLLPGELGNPIATGHQRMCVYDAAGLVRELTAPAARVCGSVDPRWCWGKSPSTVPVEPFRYSDRTQYGNPTQLLLMRSGTSPRPQVIWKAKGPLLADAPLGLAPPVTVELSSPERVRCLGAIFGAADVKRNDTRLFRARR